MPESAHTQEWMIPFFELMSWLQARARVSASTRPALDADDLQNDVVSRYLAEAEDWFEGETNTTPLQRGRTFMKFLLWQEVTKYDRRVAREKRGASRADASELDDLVFDIEAVAISESHSQRVERALDHPVVRAEAFALKNAVYRLTFLGLHLSGDTTFDHFEAGRKVVLRALDAAWNLFGDHRNTDLWEEQLSHRRRTFGEILRSTAAMGSLSESEIKTCYDWLNRTVLRARIQLCARLEALEGGLT